MESETPKNFSYAEIKKLVLLLESSSLQHLALRRGCHKLTLSKDSKAQSHQQVQSASSFVPTATDHRPITTSTIQLNTQHNTIEEQAHVDEIQEGEVLDSPMVGTFYRASSPDNPNFVESGSVVKKGQVLCIIEAMKMMNQIKAPRSGTIGTIVATNGQPVEFGQPLLYII